MTETGQTTVLPMPNHKRRLRNYLVDTSLQLRYTLFILALSVFLTAVLGYKIYQATRETSRIVTMTGLVDPATGEALREQFRANDRVVLFGIAGFGILLMVSVAGAGIWMTHKIAGPLHNLAMTCAQIRDDRLPPTIRHIRRGDLLHGFYADFAEMYGALRNRVTAETELLDRTVAAIEAQPACSAELDAVLGELRAARRRKQESLQPPEAQST
jgi:hypothetical protein